MECDVCGKFIAINDFDSGATRTMTIKWTGQDSEHYEDYETLCKKHAKRDDEVKNGN